MTFNDASSIDGVLADSEHYIDGKLVECKKAVPKEAPIASALTENRVEHFEEAPQETNAHILVESPLRKPTQVKHAPLRSDPSAHLGAMTGDLEE